MALKQMREGRGTARYAKTAAAIAAGDIVMIDSAGAALTMAASAANQGCVGVAVADAAAADAEVRVQFGTFKCVAGNIAATSINLKVYGASADVIDETAGTNFPLVGILREVVSATEGWVSIHPDVNAATV